MAGFVVLVLAEAVLVVVVVAGADLERRRNYPQEDEKHANGSQNTQNSFVSTPSPSEGPPVRTQYLPVSPEAVINITTGFSVCVNPVFDTPQL